MTFQSRTRWFTPVVFAALLLSACGFQLRGQIDIPTPLQNLTLALESGSSEFNRDLRIALAKSDINIVEEPPREGLYELKVNPLKTSDTVLARASDNDVTQIERRISSTYFVRDEEGKALWGPRNSLWKKRAYSKCKIACSTPPMYWSTGSQ